MNATAYSDRCTLMLVRVTEAAPATYSLATAAELVGMPAELLRYYCRRGFLGADRAQAAADPTFDDDALYALRRLEHYRRQHHLDRATLRLILGLQREVERLQTELRFRRGRDRP